MFAITYKKVASEGVLDYTHFPLFSGVVVAQFSVVPSFFLSMVPISQIPEYSSVTTEVYKLAFTYYDSADSLEWDGTKSRIKKKKERDRTGS